MHPTDQSFNLVELESRIARDLIYSQDVAYALVAPDLRILKASANFGTLLPEIQGSSLEGTRLPELLLEFATGEAMLVKVLAGEMPFYRLDQVNRTTSDTEVRYLDFNVIPLDESEPGKGLLLIVEDSTQIGELEQLLVQDRNQLRLAQTQLARANEELRRLNQLKSLFLSMAAHDLRAPLSAIRGFADLLERVLQDESGADVGEFISVIQTQVDRMAHLIDDFLDLDLIERGKLAVYPMHCNLASLTGEVVDSIRQLAAEASLTIELDIFESQTWAFADPARVRQILYNLLSNAIKYTPAGGRVRVRAWRDEQNSFIQIEDNGSGMSPDELENLFTLYYRTESAALSAVRGTGLGLFIVKSLMEAHGGNVRVESQVGKGTTFRIQFPQSPAQKIRDHSQE